VKGVRSKEKLAYKWTLMNVIMSKEDPRIRTLTRVLNTNPLNIMYVVQRWKKTKVFNSSQWAYLIWKWQIDGLDETTIACVVDWWKDETQMSANRIPTQQGHGHLSTWGGELRC
jgi:hypothetical protein